MTKASPRTPERRGQLMLRTECAKCGKVLPSPTRAIVHYRNCRVKTLVNGHRRRDSSPVVDVPMKSYSPPDHMVCSPSCSDRGDQWWTTGCLCNCHYVGTTSRRMAKGQEPSGARLMAKIPGCEPEDLGSTPSPLTNTQSKRTRKEPAKEASAGSTKIIERAGRALS